MKPIPFWKVKREFRRFSQQLLGSPVAAMEWLFNTPYYDLWLARQRQTTAGGIAPSKKVAIYLIFPAQGVLGSHLLALEYLMQAGYAPLVVSNLPLTAADREQILSRCWRLIERPNYGYDFGGYRDAVLSLGPDLAGLERLALFNDSAWFPLPGSQDWLPQAEALAADFVGVAPHFGMKRVAAEDYERINWQYDSARSEFHYASYALLLSQNVLKRPDFGRFWKGFRLTNRKNRVVRRGEIGLSQWVVQRGLKHASTVDMAVLPQALQALPDARLLQIFDRLIIPADVGLIAMHARLRGRIAELPDWRNHVVRFVLTTVAREGISYALPEFTCIELGVMFLKKTPIWLTEASSDISLAMIRDLNGPGAGTIYTEACALRAARAPGFAETSAVASAPVPQ
jgi:hypothetical protein